jgi:hypothetical protein
MSKSKVERGSQKPFQSLDLIGCPCQLGRVTTADHF